MFKHILECFSSQSLDFPDASEKGVFDIFFDTQLKMSIPNSQQSWWVFTKFMHLISYLALWVFFQYNSTKTTVSHC